MILCSGWNPLHAAAAHGHFKVAKRLLTVFSKIDAGPKLAHQMLQLPTEPDAKPLEGRWSPMYLAALNGHNDIVELLGAEISWDAGGLAAACDKEVQCLFIKVSIFTRCSILPLN